MTDVVLLEYYCAVAFTVGDIAISEKL